MAIVTRQIHGHQYAYLVTREGKKVVHKYLGPTSRPEVRKKLSEKKEVSMIPDRFRSLFWDTSPGKVNLKQHMRYIIERVLEFGDIDALGWLQKVYPTQTIIDVLSVNRAISTKSRNFWEIWFGVKHV